MPQLRHHEIVVDGSTIEIIEAGPSRCPDTVVIVGADDDVVRALLVRLGRFTRVVSIPVPGWSPAIIETLDLQHTHLVVDLGANTLDDVVDVLQWTVTID